MRRSLLLWAFLFALVVSAFAAGAMPQARALDVMPPPEPLQGSCGDTRCSPPEDCHSCPADCGSCCGDHHCAPPEDCDSCPSDCC